MPEIDPLTVLIAGVATFLSGGVYYGIFGSALARLTTADPDKALPTGVVMGIEVLRCFVLALVVTGLATSAGVTTWVGGLVLGLALFAGFPLVLWVGAVTHERTPWQLAVLHAGDWLAKLVLIGVVAGIRG